MKTSFFLNLFDLFFPLSSMVFELNEEKWMGFFCCKIYLRKQVWEHIQRVAKDALFTGVKDRVQIIVWFLPECYRSANPSEVQSFTSAGKIVWNTCVKCRGVDLTPRGRFHVPYESRYKCYDTIHHHPTIQLSGLLVKSKPLLNFSYHIWQHAVEHVGVVGHDFDLPFISEAVLY